MTLGHKGAGRVGRIFARSDHWIKDVQKCTIPRVFSGVMIDMIIGLSTALALTGPAVAAETGTAK